MARLHRFAGHLNGAEEIQRVARLGLISILDDGCMGVDDARFLDTGAALVHLGVPVDVVLDQLERLLRETDAIAARFIDVFERHLYDPAARADEMRAQLAELRTHAQRVVTAALERSLARLGAERLSAQLTTRETGSEH
jgi:hypothetical protein